MRADLEQIDLRVMQLLVGGRERPRRACESDEARGTDSQRGLTPLRDFDTVVDTPRRA